MKCKQVQAALAIAPREWSEAEHQQIEAHLPTCAACAALARDYARQADRLTVLPRVSLSMAQQQAIMAQVLRAPESSWSRRLVNAFGAAAGVLILGVVVAALLWAFNHPTSLSLTATVTSVLTPTMTATPTINPASPTPAPPSPAPPPTVMLPNGVVATVTPDLLAATEVAAQQATWISSRATVFARATQAPFPTAGPVMIQTGRPALASVQRGDLTFELRLPKDTYLAGEGGQAEVRVTNNTTEVLFIREASLTLLDNQGDEPQPWPWEPMQLIGRMRGLGWGPLVPGQTLTQTLKFQLPPLDQTTGKSYQLGAALDFSRASLASPQGPDDVYLRAETGLIPLQVTVPTAGQQLTANLEMDWSSWRLHVTDASGQTPPGPMWGSIEAGFFNGAMSGSLPESNDGQWSGEWNHPFTTPDQDYIRVRMWVAAPGYVTAAVTRTLATDQAQSNAELNRPFNPGELATTHHVFASLEEAQAALKNTIYQPTHLPAGTFLEKIEMSDFIPYDNQHRVRLTQVYRLPGDVFLMLSQQSTTEDNAAALWGTARYAPDAQQVAVDQREGYLIQRFGFRLLDWQVNDQVFELRAPVSAISSEQLMDIAAGVQPLR